MYIDAIYDKERDRILIAERVAGKRVLRDALPELVFYYTDPNGLHRSIFGDRLAKVPCHDKKTFHRKLAEKQRNDSIMVFESDINPVFRYLANHYMGADTPALHVGFFDIEVDFDATRGYAPTDDPFAPVTAITLYNSATAVLHSFLLCPPSVSLDQAQAITGAFPDAVLFDDEALLLASFLECITDIDCLSGWNSEGYDIPYLVNRVRRLLGEDATRCFCLWDQRPREREYTKFGRPFKTYELVGRVHLDYLLLYQKHNTQQQHSYRLDFIGEIEVGDVKTPYEGTLDDLYKKDFRRFIEYNRQDVKLLVKIDAKKKFIDLANQIAHANCVLLKTTMGSVSLVETAIINEMHAMGVVVPDRKPRPKDDEDDEQTPVVGAYVAIPKSGLHEHVGAVDLNSLYPSAIRALNLSPETIYGQIRPTETMKLVESRIAAGTPRAEAWDGVFAIQEVEWVQTATEHEITVDLEGGSTQTLTAKQLREHIFDPANHLCISANGTIVRTDKEGMIPALLAKWYADRKVMQAKARDLGLEANGIEIDAELAALIADAQSAR